jgi:hypothetical protein
LQSNCTLLTENWGDVCPHVVSKLRSQGKQSSKI